MTNKRQRESSGTKRIQYPDPVFEAFAIEMVGRQRIESVRKLVERELGRGWKVQRFGEGTGKYEVINEKVSFSVEEAWESMYRLRRQPGVGYAEPVFAAAVSNRLDWNEVPVSAQSVDIPSAAAEAAISQFCGDAPAHEKSKDPGWSLREVRVFEAWDHFFPGAGNRIAENIVIGHPDTGYRKHPEIAGNFLINRGFDFVDGDTDAEDGLEEGFLLAPGHGTGTASVIVSPKEGAQNPPGEKHVLGIAPGAKVIPFRVARSVVLLSTMNLAHAIERATTEGAHIISISFIA